MSATPWCCKSDAALHFSLRPTLQVFCFLFIHPAYTNTHEAVTFSSATLTLHIHDPTSTFLSAGVALPFSGTRNPYVCTCLYNHQHNPLCLLAVGKHPYSSSHLFIYQPTLLSLSEARERPVYGGLTKGSVWCLSFTCLFLLLQPACPRGPGRLMRLVVDTCYVASRCVLGLPVCLSLCVYVCGF